ncbi:MAG: transcriptional repressor, partial [Desulfovibrio sp.]|nr:transcriptional repressor [Desulfovibrio sp.]
MTRQRSVILEELRKVDTHPTADELYTIVRVRLPHISLGTVYRNLEYLVAAGEIARLESAGTSMRFDGDVSGHQHVR